MCQVHNHETLFTITLLGMLAFGQGFQKYGGDGKPWSSMKVRIGAFAGKVEPQCSVTNLTRPAEFSVWVKHNEELNILSIGDTKNGDKVAWYCRNKSQARFGQVRWVPAEEPAKTKTSK